MSNLHKYITQALKKYKPQNDENSVYQQLKYVMSCLNHKGVRCNFDKIESANNRVIMYAVDSSNINAVSREANGTIYDYTTWQPVCVPPPVSYDLQKNINTFSQTELSDYRFSKLEDGTTINIYHYNGEWRYSTYRGIDVKSVNCRHKTFGEALTDVGIDPSDWDVNQTYTVGFTHPECHYTKVKKAWIICSSDPSGTSYNYNPQVGLSCLDEIKFESVDAVMEIVFDNTTWGVVARNTKNNISYILRTPRLTALQTLEYDGRVGNPGHDCKKFIEMATGQLPMIDPSTYIALYPQREAAYHAAQSAYKRALTLSEDTSIGRYLRDRIAELRSDNPIPEFVVDYVHQNFDHALWEKYFTEAGVELPELS